MLHDIASKFNLMEKVVTVMLEALGLDKTLAAELQDVRPWQHSTPLHTSFQVPADAPRFKSPSEGPWAKAPPTFHEHW